MRARFPRKAASPFIVGAVFLLVLVSALTGLLRPRHQETGYGRSRMAVVSRVVDGDTFHTVDGEKVRLLGIDTPEMHESAKLRRDMARSGKDAATIMRAGRKAWRFTSALLAGKTVRLDTDVQSRDKYGRLLAYVYLEDGTFVNRVIVAEGYAVPLTIPPNVLFAAELREDSRRARAAGRGLWAEP